MTGHCTGRAKDRKARLPSSQVRIGSWPSMLTTYAHVSLEELCFDPQISTIILFERFSNR